METKINAVKPDKLYGLKQTLLLPSRQLTSPACTWCWLSGLTSIVLWFGQLSTQDTW